MIFTVFEVLLRTRGVRRALEDVSTAPEHSINHRGRPQ